MPTDRGSHKAAGVRTVGRWDENKLTKRDLLVYKKNIVEGKTLKKTAQELGICTETVKRTKKKLAFREYALAALEQLGYSVDTHMRRLVELTMADRYAAYRGERTAEPDNPVRIQAAKEIGQIMGLHAPKETNVQHNIAMSSDEELFAEIDEAAIRCKLVESVVVDPEECERLLQREQDTSCRDSGEGETASLSVRALLQEE
jgi:hypothetical protein